MPAASQPTLEVRVVVEEDAFSHEAPGHPMYALWNYGSTTLVRNGQTVLATGIATLAGRVPLNNLVCTLGVRRDGGRWQWQPLPDSGPTREPCPVGLLRASSELLVTVGPVTDRRIAAYAPIEPGLLVFRQNGEALQLEAGLTPWAAREDRGLFWDHSRRSIAVDPAGARLFLMENAGPSHTHAEWTVSGPRGADPLYGQVQWPEPRSPGERPGVLAYAQSAIQGEAVHLFAVEDIREPVPEWGLLKTRGRADTWDYVFRRLFYRYAPAVGRGPFEPWVEIANVEATGGELRPGDMRVDPDGTVHLVWTEFRTWPPVLRDAFFNDLAPRYRLQYASVKNGRIVTRHTLLQTDEANPSSQGAPVTARLHRLTDGSLVVLYSLLPRPPLWQQHNQLMLLGAGGQPGEIHDLGLSEPLVTFVTASERAGSAPSDTIDLLGQVNWYSTTVRYVRLDISRRAAQQVRALDGTSLDDTSLDGN